MIPGIAQAGPENVKRIYGNSRVQTSIAVSKEVYPDGSAENVVLAGYHGEVDALTGTLLASAKDAPLILIHKYNDVIKSELTRLGAKNIYLLGGKTVISETVEKELKDSDYNVVRVSGKGRFETAVAVAKESGGKSTHVFLANDGRSGSLADALAAGTVSGKNQQPILLTSKDKIPKTTLDALRDIGVKHITIVGGIGVVNKDIEISLEKLGYKVDRVAGENRWKTATEIANKFFNAPEKAIVSNDGRSGSFADALLGGYLGAKKNAPILLTKVNELPSSTKKYIYKNIKTIRILGGESVINKDIYKDIYNEISKKTDNKPPTTNPLSALNEEYIRVTSNKDIYINIEQEVLNLINKDRKAERLEPLALCEDLSKLAKIKSSDMIDYSYFSHTSPNYGGMITLYRKYIPSRRTFGENIMKTWNHSAENIHKNFMNSSGHRSNIMEPNFKKIGIGVIKGSNYYYITESFSGL